MSVSTGVSQTGVDKVLHHLKGLPPLTVVTQKQVQQATGMSYDVVNAAFQNNALGTGNTSKFPRLQYYFLRSEIVPAPGLPARLVYLSLPALRLVDLQGNAAESFANTTIKELSDRYPVEVLEYWGRAAQYRSVDLIRKVMKDVKKATNGQCMLCLQLGVPVPGKALAHHLIRRTTSFWTCLKAVVDRKIDLFTAAGVRALEDQMRADPYHTDPRYIIPLCGSCDRAVQATIRPKGQRA